MAAPNKENELKAITDSIFKLDKPNIEENRKPQICDFINTAVNGDDPIAHLALNASLSDDKKGILVYILTNLRLIKIQIGLNQNEIESNSFPLKTIIGIERKLIDNDRTQFAITFQNGSVGLRYSIEDTKITEFFQKIDQPRLPNHG